MNERGLGRNRSCGKEAESKEQGARSREEKPFSFLHALGSTLYAGFTVFSLTLCSLLYAVFTGVIMKKVKALILAGTESTVK